LFGGSEQFLAQYQSYYLDDRTPRAKAGKLKAAMPAGR
jgi:hypothetical protein